MNIKITDSWLREFLKTEASARKIVEVLSLSGPSVERLTRINGDYIYDIEITTNRVDLMSVIGIAREANCILEEFKIKSELNLPDFDKISTKIESTKELSILIQDKKHICKRVLGVIIENVSPKKSPKFIQKRLENSGIRAKNILVDITNYIMTELGHPTHVFDYDILTTKKMILRKAEKGEQIVSLDNKKYILPGGDVIIDNGKGDIIDLPGIIGTKNSVVNDKTKRILFFIESNDPRAIRKSSMSLGIRTVAATINEKGTDPLLAKKALLYGIYLYKKFSQGKVASKIYDIYPNPYIPKKIYIKHQHIINLIGTYIKPDKCVSILNRLDIESRFEEKSGTITSLVPSSRANDIIIKEDLIEEIARIYGYYNLNPILPEGKLPEQNFNLDKQFIVESKIKNYLSNWGYTENYSYSMISESDIKKMNTSPKNYLLIENPLSSEWVYLRRSLVASMLTVISKNQNNFSEIKMFELSNIYIPRNNQLPQELPILLVGGIIRNESFFKLKGIADQLFIELGVRNIKYKTVKKPENYWLENETADIFSCEEKIGVLGQIKRDISEKFSISEKIFFLELEIEKLTSVATLSKTYKKIPLYPPIIEDYTFTFSDNPKVGNIISKLQHINPEVYSVFVKDRFQNSFTFRIIFQDPRKNLTNKEISPVRKKIVNLIKNEFNGDFKGNI